MADLNAIADQLSELTVMEAAELSSLLEEKWGVTAAAPVAAAAPAAAGEAAAEVKDEFDVILIAAPCGLDVTSINSLRSQIRTPTSFPFSTSAASMPS